MKRSFTKQEFIAEWLTPNPDSGMTQLDELNEHWGEIVSQNGSERAMFGDSAPGSAIQEARVAATYRSVVTRLRSFGCKV